MEVVMLLAISSAAAESIALTVAIVIGGLILIGIMLATLKGEDTRREKRYGGGMVE